MGEGSEGGFVGLVWMVVMRIRRGFPGLLPWVVAARAEPLMLLRGHTDAGELAHAQI